MDRKRWQQVEVIYQAAAECKPEGRDAFLAAACAGDDDLRREVESLLAQESNDTTLDRPAADGAAGGRLGPYELLEPIGSGGMGTVFKARDTRLNRSVAIKVSSAQFSGRFATEARAVAALNHPHVCTLHDVGPNYLVMEFVEGENLAQRLQRGALPLDLTLRYGVEIADAVAAAHAHGIIHRDLKPANIMLTESGVKVLDFGLAKFKKSDGAIETQTASHAVLGTVAYMSPEQAEGNHVDARSDIFSLGMVLYEMVSGRNPFRRDTELATLAAILHQEPEPLPDKVPAELARIIARCLRKDPARRFQTVADLKLDLEELKYGATPSFPGRPRWPWVGAIAVVVLLVAAALAWRFRDTIKTGSELTPQVLTSYPGMESAAAFSPDGNKVAFVWNGEHQDNSDIYVRQIGATSPPLRLTTHPAQEMMPAWSPDDRWIAFARLLPQNIVAIMLVPPMGGPERRLAEIGGGPWLDYWAGTRDCLSWTPDGKWLAFSAAESDTGSTSLWAISVETGERRRLSTQMNQSPDFNRIGDLNPSLSPDGRALAFVRQVKSLVFGLYVQRLTGDLRPDGDPVRLTDRNEPFVRGLAWTADGAEIIYSSGDLWRVPVSGRRVPSRLPYALSAFDPATTRTRLRLAYTRVINNWNVWRLDTRTNERKTLLGSTYYMHLGPQYSPDGSRIAFQSDQSGTTEVWVGDADGSNCQRLTSFGGPVCGSPHWSPDGHWLALDSRAEGQSEIYVMAGDGGAPRRITLHPANDIGPSWSRDGLWIYFASDRSGRYEVWKTPREGGQAVQVTRSGGFVGSESPDGRNVYYTKVAPDVRFDRQSLFRMPTGGGEETQILPRVYWGNFYVTAKGIYFELDHRTIQFLDFATGKVKTLAVLDKNAVGLCASPDGAYVAWSQLDHSAHDLMLVEGFR